jgi:hypothetical protein
MSERGLTIQDVTAVLGDHHTSMPGTGGATIRYCGNVRGLEVSVVAREPGIEADPVKVVTVY